MEGEVFWCNSLVLDMLYFMEREICEICCKGLGLDMLKFRGVGIISCKGWVLDMLSFIDGDFFWCLGLVILKSLEGNWLDGIYGGGIRGDDVVMVRLTAGNEDL